MQKSLNCLKQLLKPFSGTETDFTIRYFYSNCKSGSGMDNRNRIPLAKKA
jgi:hypothetical protein